MIYPQPAPSVRVRRSDFLTALGLAEAVTARKPKIAQLGMIRARANGALVLEATDIDTSARVELPYEGEHADMVLSDPRRLRAAIVAAGGDVVGLSQFQLTAGEQSCRLALSVGALDATMPSRNPADMPECEEVAGVDFSASLSADTLREIARVVPAIATEETRYYLNGVCIWHVADWTWRFGATDGHRLMLVDLPLPDATGTIPNGTILPSRFIKLWMRLFQRCGDPIKITFGPKIARNHPDATVLDLPVGAMRFAASSTFGAVRCAITTKLIDGTYPDVEKVVPKEALSVARFDRQGLLQAINAVGAMADGKLRAIKLTFGKDIATVSLAMSEAHSQMVIPCRHNCREGAAVGYNGRYLVDCIVALRGKEVTFSWDQPRGEFDGGPVLITDETDTTFRCVLMSMRV